MTLDLTQPYACRNGAEAGATKGPDGRLYGWFVHLYHSKSATPCPGVWKPDGTADFVLPSMTGLDLINTPQRRTLDVWVNVYDGAEDGGPVPVAWGSREAADLNCAPERRTACLHIVREYLDGEGLT